MALGVNIKPKEKILMSTISGWIHWWLVQVQFSLSPIHFPLSYIKWKFRMQDDSRVHDYMDSQPDINTKMRSILIDWLIDVHRKFELMPETFYLTVNILDRYLSKKIVSRRELQLVGISSMVIASKYEEIWAPQVCFFTCFSKNSSDFGHYNLIWNLNKSGLHRVFLHLICRSMTLFACQTMHTLPIRYFAWRKQFWGSWSGIWQFQPLMSSCLDTSKHLFRLMRR